MKTRFLIAALLVPVALVQGTVIVNDSFADFDRTNQDLANNSMAWYTSSGTSTVISPAPEVLDPPTPAIPDLTQNTGSSGRALLAFFTDSGAVSVGAGETLLVRFVIRYNGDVIFNPAANDFRVAVFNSFDNRDTTTIDNFKGTSTTSPNPDFVDYTAYAFTGGIGPVRNVSLRKKFVPSDPILIGSTNVYTALGSTTNTGHTEVIPGDDYIARMMITNTGSSSVITYSLDNTLGTNFALITREDSDSPYTAFDGVIIHSNSNVMDGFTIKSLEVQKVSAPSAPAIAGEITGANFVVTCPSAVGFLYHLIVSDTELDENDFSAGAVESKAGTGSDLTFTVAGPPPAGEKRFYKVIATVNP